VEELKFVSPIADPAIKLPAAPEIPIPNVPDPFLTCIAFGDVVSTLPTIKLYPGSGIVKPTEFSCINKGKVAPTEKFIFAPVKFLKFASPAIDPVMN